MHSVGLRVCLHVPSTWPYNTRACCLRSASVSEPLESPANKMHTCRTLSCNKQVMESWRLILGNSNGYMRFQLEDVRVYAGDEQALVTCVEVIDATDTRGRCLLSSFMPCLSTAVCVRFLVYDRVFTLTTP